MADFFKFSSTKEEKKEDKKEDKKDGKKDPKKSGSGSILPTTDAVADGLDDCCPKLTFKERMTGFACCAGLGYFITLMAFG